jgi:hypothetical protein
MSTDIKITEGVCSDISTVIAYFANPTEYWPNGQLKMCDTWSCFNNEYKLHNEREFIHIVDAANPGKYSSYHISWSDCN